MPAEVYAEVYVREKRIRFLTWKSDFSKRAMVALSGERPKASSSCREKPHRYWDAMSNTKCPLKTLFLMR